MVGRMLAGLIVGFVVVAAPAGAVGEEEEERMRVYIGTYTRGDSEGVYVSYLDARSGELSEPRLAAEAANPSFLALAADGRHLYAVNELPRAEGEDAGTVSAFRVEPDGSLGLLNRRLAGGGAPCHLTVDPTGRWVLVANYSGGNVVTLPVAEDGRLGEVTANDRHEGSSAHPRRQQGPHAHSIYVDAAGRHAVAANLGTDRLYVYRFDAESGALERRSETELEPGSGPRHLAFHPSGEYAYAINELSSTVTAFTYDTESGRLDAVQTVATLPEGFEGRSTTAEVRVHPSGRFLYGSNRGHDSIAAFRIADDGRLTLIGHTPTGGRTPRNFNIDPTGRWLVAANQNSDDLHVFRIDPETGELGATGHRIEVPSPVCVVFHAGQ